MTKYTPIYKEHVKLHAQIMDFQEWKMPIKYNDIKTEHLNVRKYVGIFDVSHMGEILITGSNALALCERLFTNNITKAINGQALYCGMLTKNGTFIDDLILYKFSQTKFLICTNACNDKKDFIHIKQVANNEFSNKNLKIISLSNKYAQIAIQGPKSLKVLNKLLNEQLNIPFYHFTTKNIILQNTYINLIISRTGYTGEKGFEIFIPANRAIVLWKKLLEIGVTDNIMPCGLASRDSLRLEAGMCLYGNEIDETITPFEARLNWITKLKKTISIIGKESLLKQKKIKIFKQLCGLELEKKFIARNGYYVMNKENKIVGKITSGNIAYSLNKFIAMAYINHPFQTINTKLFIKIRNNLVQSKIVPLPFYKKRI
jgi:aminomethyltransferase